MLDEGLVEAAQTIRALEDGDEEDFYPIEASAPSPPQSPPHSANTKRPRNGNEDEGVDGREKRRITNGSGGGGGGGGGGLLSGEAMENLRYYAEMARKQAEESRASAAGAAKKKKAAPVGMALLGGYGSGDESD
jgi:hypothetical protein